MKTLEELQAVRETYHKQLNLRREDHTRTRVIVAMDTCGIASGAKPVLMTFSDLVGETQSAQAPQAHRTAARAVRLHRPV